MQQINSILFVKLVNFMQLLLIGYSLRLGRLDFNNIIKTFVLLILKIFSPGVPSSSNFQGLMYTSVIIQSIQSIQYSDIIKTMKILELFSPKLRTFQPKYSALYAFSTKAQPSKIELILEKYKTQLEQSRIMQKIAPRKFTEADLGNLSYKLRYSGSKNHLQSLDKGLSAPIWDLLDRGGKRWRPVLAMLVAQLLGKKRQEVLDIAAFCQVLHNGSLIIDDIEDGSDTRRKKPCIHKIYGVDVAVNTGNFMYFSPLLYLLSLEKYSPEQKNEFSKIYAEQCTYLHFGQNWDIFWHNTNHIIQSYPNESQYLQMTAFKTSVLPRLAVRMVSAYAGASQRQDNAVIYFVQNLGVGFQIQDDLLNLEGEQFKNSKGYNGEDIHEGKITLIVIHHVQTAPEKQKKRLVQILQMKTTQQKLIEQAIQLLRNSGSIDYAKKVMADLIQEGNDHLDKYFPHSETRQLLKQLAKYGITRKN